ncbi:hypothetical protein [Helicobacter saguini]|nr:hypothetical protein [Helicobacter saguini]
MAKKTLTYKLKRESLRILNQINRFLKYHFVCGSLNVMGGGGKA